MIPENGRKVNGMTISWDHLYKFKSVIGIAICIPRGLTKKLQQY